MENKDAITYGIIGFLAYLVFKPKKVSREAIIDEIISRCSQIEGCVAERPNLEALSDEQLEYLLDYLKNLPEEA